MIRLFRSSLGSMVLGYAWRNRSKIVSAVSSFRSRKAPKNPPQGYANIVGDDSLVDTKTVKSNVTD